MDTTLPVAQLKEAPIVYHRDFSFIDAPPEHDWRLACGWLADCHYLLKPNMFSGFHISSALTLIPDLDEKLCGDTESYPRGPVFGISIDHDWRLACGFLADSPHLLMQNTFSAVNIKSSEIVFSELD